MSMHPSFDPKTIRRREAEFAKAKTAAEVARLQERWQLEDDAVLAAQDYRVKEVTELRARVAKLEKILGRGGENLINGISKAAGTVLRRLRAEERERILGEIEARGYVTYGGVWDEGSPYTKGSLVTHAGGAWVAVAPVAKGERPGKGPSWKLAVKADSRAPVTA
jgi:hypothetical protein